MRFGVLAFVVF